MQGAGLRIDRRFRVIASARRRRHGKTNRIPPAFWRSPTATARVTEIAKGFKNVLCRRLLLVSRSRAVAAPSATQWQARGMRPIAIFDFLYWHEIRTGQTELLILIEQTGPAILVDSFYLTSFPRHNRAALCSNLVAGALDHGPHLRAKRHPDRKSEGRFCALRASDGVFETGRF